jgi:predicted ATPase
VRRDLPSGTVTFLFTDIEGSTKLLHELGAVAYAEALTEHRRVLRETFARHGGVEVDTQGDAFFVAFPTAPGALEAAAESQEALTSGPISVRMGLHTGTPHVTDEGYVGDVVHEGARIAAVGHGGQILLSAQTFELVEVDVTDLGEHRLKDIEEPVPILQLGATRFPPLKTISNTNLPRPASSFVGREREIGQVAALLQDGARLLTLTGPGGTGKTRLAIESAAELVPEFKAGVFWVELAPLRDPVLVIETIAQTLGAQDGVAHYVGEREMLLVLDNLEQVIEAAPDLATLVESCPHLRVLVTSRELLRVRGEVEYPVAPLADPEAVALFCERTRMEPDEDIARLCRALDSLPLAVELAAARANVLSPAQILERLSQRLDLLKGGRDADPRQQTLRATIEWSHELLSAEEQRLFSRLAVFPGGCTLDAAEAVADASLDALQALVDKSLVRHTTERFWMLETIREFAIERLDDPDEGDGTRDRHASYFLALAEEAEPHLFGTHPGPWLDRLEVEHDNLRAALDRFEGLGDIQSVLRLAGALSEFWGVKGHLTESRRRTERALDADDRPTAARAKALNAAADAANGVGDTEASMRRAAEGLALHRALGLKRGIADALLLLGIAHNNVNDFARGSELIEEGIPLFAEMGDDHGVMEATRLLAWASNHLGNPARSQELLRDNILRARALGDAQIEERSLDMLAGYAIDEGHGAEALKLLEEAYRLNRQLGDVYWTPIIVCRLGGALVVDGESVLAATVLSAGEALLDEIGSSSPWISEMNDVLRDRIRAQLDDAAFAAAWEAGTGLTADEAVALALDRSDRGAGGHPRDESACGP